MVATLLSLFTIFGKNMADRRVERTFLAVKPDGVQRGLIGKIVARFEERGYKLVASKFLTPPQELLRNHYKELSDKPFFPGLIKYMGSGPVFAMVWEGTNVVKMARKMLGATNPQDSEPGTIRGDYCIEVGRNVCHGSDSVETALREIALWFKQEELQEYDLAQKDWIFE
ncbi:hypothetical protein BsWGS_17724 [Bradybaena similaris]